MRSLILTLTLLLAGYAWNAYTGRGPSIEVAAVMQGEAYAAAQSVSDSVPGSVGGATKVALPSAKAASGPFELDLSGTEQTWRDWMARHGVTAGAMTLGKDGDILQSASLRRSPDAAYPVASLSKAITAMCLNDMLAGTRYDWSSTLRDLVPVLGTLNLAPHEAAQALSLGDLASHSTGFPKNLEGVETAGEGHNLYTQQHIAREALHTSEHLSDQNRFVYSNVNYAALGQVIVALSGLAYEDACKPRIMTPAGATGAIVGGRMWATAGFGGWSVSTEDYARFVMHWYHPNRPWVTAPTEYAYNADKRSGLGVFQNMHKDGGYLITHTGLWDSKNEDRRHGALFLTTNTGATFVANWQGSLPKKAYSDLRKAVIPYLH